MGLFDWMKPPPNIAEIEDEDVVKKRYKYWRLRIFLGMYIGYTFFYFTRKSFTFAMPTLMVDLGLDKSDLGILGSILAITYGGSKFFSGMLADRSNPRYFMSIGLIITGILNICFGLSSSIFFFAIFWGLNGLFQGWGWPPCARLLTYWYSQSERGTWWGFCSTSHSIGGALIPLIAGLCAQYWGWRYAMYIPGVLCILIGFYMINRLRDTPQSLGLPPIEKYKKDYPSSRVVEEENLSFKRILIEYVLSNKYIWILAIAYFFVYVIRTAVTDWSVLYLVETKGYSLIEAGAGIFWFEVGGILGTLISGWASDKIFRGRRGPINVLFSLGVMVAIYAFWQAPAILLVDYSIMFLIGFLIFGPQVLIGMAAVELSHKKAAATANGFTGWLAYLGAAGAGWPLGFLSEKWGWDGLFIVLGLCALISSVLLIPLWSIKTNPKYLREEPNLENAKAEENSPAQA